MGKKAEVGTPKWLANKMKSKGLQKLRWYCQMCQKQCRDQNGFKCHIESESHQRQLLIFANNPGKFLYDYSKEFECGFMNILKRAHGDKRVKANKVYQEYIRDKDHVHMNSTRWTTLTGFCYYLGKTGKCKVDETDEGLFIAWIDRDPDTIARQEALAKKKKLEKDDNERLAEFIDKQVQKAKEGKEEAEDEEPKFTELVRESEEDVLKLELKVKETKPLEGPSIPRPGKSVFNQVDTKPAKRIKKEPSTDRESSKKKSALEEIIEEEKRQAAKKASSSKGKSSDSNHVKKYWLKKDIVVKVVTKSLGEKYYKQKGYIKEVIDRYVAVVVMLNTGSKLKLDQEHLETVIPGVGKPVLVVNGEFRGEEGELLSIDVDKFCAKIKLVSGEKISLPYEHFSKLHSQ